MNRKLEIGSGKKPQPGYEHLDFRSDLPHIDHVHDLTTPLPFSANTFDEVYADQVLEHFPWIKSLSTLKDWVRVLKPAGKLHIIVPDFEYIIQGYINNTGQSNISKKRKSHAINGMGAWNSKTCTIIKLFGGQDYSGNFHYAAFDSELIVVLFKTIGLKKIKTVAKNGRLTAIGIK